MKRASIFVVATLFLCLAPALAAPTADVSTISTGGKAAHLRGVNFWYPEWRKWTRDVMARELNDARLRGFNFIRTEVPFYKFYDFAQDKVRPEMDWQTYEDLTYFVNMTKALGFVITVVPFDGAMDGPWNWDRLNGRPYYEARYWWTSPVLQGVEFKYYRTFATWVKAMGWTHIVYISVWWEPSSYLDWTDGAFTTNMQSAYASSFLNYAEADADWRGWLQTHSLPSVPLTIQNIEANIEAYIAWSRSRFEEMTERKAEAVKSGWPEVKVGGEIGCFGYTSYQTDWYPRNYLQSTAWPYLDVIGYHDYETYTRYIRQLLDTTPGKMHVVEELNMDYRAIDPDDTQAWWSAFEPKLNLSYLEGDGFAIWAWIDYVRGGELKKWGLKTQDFQPRPTLSLVEDWMNAQV